MNEDTEVTLEQKVASALELAGFAEAPRGFETFPSDDSCLVQLYDDNDWDPWGPEHRLICLGYAEVLKATFEVTLIDTPLKGFDGCCVLVSRKGEG